MNCTDIVIVTDYHAKAIQFRLFDPVSGEDRTFNRVTSIETIEAVLGEARKVALPRGGKWCGSWRAPRAPGGWARVKKLLGDRASFVLANVLQLPLPPRAYRRKTDELSFG